MEIPRLVSLARDDSYIESLGFLGEKGLGLYSKRHTMTKESLNRAAGGRCVAAGRWYAEKPTTARCPPLGSRGRGPWSGRGSQRVKPRLVSPFEKRRLSPKGQGFLRVVCARARHRGRKVTRISGWRSLGSFHSLGMTVILSRWDFLVKRALVCTQKVIR